MALQKSKKQPGSGIWRLHKAAALDRLRPQSFSTFTATWLTARMILLNVAEDSLLARCDHDWWPRVETKRILWQRISWLRISENAADFVVKPARCATSFSKRAIFPHRHCSSNRIASSSRFSISPIFISGRPSSAYHVPRTSPVLRPLSPAESKVLARQQYFCPRSRLGFRFPVVRPLCKSRSGLRLQWYVPCFLIRPRSTVSAFDMT